MIHRFAENGDRLDVHQIRCGELPGGSDFTTPALLDAGECQRRAWRWEPRVHPCTLNGRQVDVLNGDEWVEVWECGLAHPDVLAGAGL